MRGSQNPVHPTICPSWRSFLSNKPDACYDSSAMTRINAILLLLVSLLLGGPGCSSLPSQNRIRHPIQTDYSVNDPEFAESMSHLLGAPLVPGNTVVELLNGDRIFPAMLDAIRRAQKT